MCTVVDEELVEVNSRVFDVGDTAFFLEGYDIRGAMLINYIVSIPDVSACEMQAKKVTEYATPTMAY